MRTKPRLDIILGATYTFSDIEGLCALEADFDVIFHAFETPIIHHLLSSAKLKIYAVIEDMPSYMRGIEPELAGSHAILALGNQNISSFQACRAADKMGVPFFLIVDEMREVTKEQYGHIYVLQSEVLRFATKVYPLTDAIRHNLLAAGCAKGKTKAIPPFISPARYVFSSKRRKKFRDYLQLSDEQILVLFHQPLRAGFQPRLAMEWLRYVRAEDEALFDKLVLLYCKGGELARSLKSEALNYDLSANVRFLDQDTAGFVRDLYAAGDMVLAHGIPCEDHLVELFPRWQVETVACGIVPIYPQSIPVKKLIKKTIHHHHDHDLDDIYQAAKTYDAKRKVTSREGLAATQHAAISEALTMDKTMAMISSDISAAIAANTAAQAAGTHDSEPQEGPAGPEVQASSVHGNGIITIVSDNEPFRKLQQDYVAALKAGDTEEALATVEKLIDASRAEPTVQADFYFKKAELHLTLQNLTATADPDQDPFADLGPAIATAEESLEICLGLDASHEDARFALAKLLHDTSRVAEAIGILTECAQPSDALSFLLAQCQLTEGRVDRATEIYLDLLRKEYQPQVVATRLCRMLEGHPLAVDEKIDALKQAYLADPSIRMIRQHLIAAFLTAGMADEGKAWIEEHDALVDKQRLLEEGGEQPECPTRKKAS